MGYVLSGKTVKMFEMFARNVFGINEEDDYTTTNARIDKTEKIFCEMGLPKTLSELNINDMGLKKWQKRL